MPQMFPINWIILFVSFILILLTSMTMTFFISSHFPSNKDLKQNYSNSLNWKW